MLELVNSNNLAQIESYMYGDFKTKQDNYLVTLNNLIEYQSQLFDEASKDAIQFTKRNLL